MQQASGTLGRGGVRGAAAIPASHVGEGGESGLRVTELGMIDRLFWESNILFGRGRVEEVRKLAKEAQEKGQEGGFILLMALSRLDHDKQCFEDIAVDYAVQTGNSPPVWLDAHDPKVDAAMSAKKQTTVAIASLTADGIIETTIKMETSWELVLDFSSVTKIDTIGLEILQQGLQERIDRGESTRLVRADRVLRHIIPKLKDAAEVSDSVWRFCFNCMRIAGTRDKFDELVSVYVEKTGSDMPAWKDLSGKEERDRAEAAAAAAAKPTFDGYMLKESLGEASPALIKELIARPEYAKMIAAGKTFAIDFTEVVRWSIEEMLKVQELIRQFEKMNVMLEFRNVNEMTLALMKAFGLEKRVQLFAAGEVV